MEECKVSDWEKNTKDLNWERVRVHDKLVSMIANTIPSGKILEIGAQAGLDAEHLAKMGYEVTAIDYGQEAINLLKQRENLNVTRADALKLPFKEESFDLVYSQGLAEHFREPELSALIEEQKRVANKDGYVLIDVPNTFSLNTIPKQILIASGKWIVPWETQYTTKQLKNLGEQQGLEFVKSYSWGYDRFIGERLESFSTKISGKWFRKFEENYGHYFMKCIGAIFKKSK